MVCRKYARGGQIVGGSPRQQDLDCCPSSTSTAEARKNRFRSDFTRVRGCLIAGLIVLLLPPFHLAGQQRSRAVKPLLVSTSAPSTTKREQILKFAPIRNSACYEASTENRFALRLVRVSAQN